MHEGWFAAFRDDFGPTNYESLSHPSLNFRTLIAFLAFAVPYLAFLVILPGLREKRLISFGTITLQLGVGVLLIGSIVLPYWSVGDAMVTSQFRAHSNSRHEAKIGVRVGLSALNVTLKYIRPIDDPSAVYEGMYFNERYSLEGVQSMSAELAGAYLDGLPYPMLKVLEYFSLRQGAFAWGDQFRNAGHFASTLLWISFAIWCWQCVFLAFLPHHYGKVGVLCGVFILCAVTVYAFLSPNGPNIPFVSQSRGVVYLSLAYGSSFYMALAAGLLSLFFGCVLSALQYTRVYSLSTCLSSSLDETVGPRCRFGRSSSICLDVGSSSGSSAFSDVSAFGVSCDESGKSLEAARNKHNQLLEAAQLKAKVVGGGASSGFQSGSSIRSSTNSTLSSSTSAMQRTLSTDTIGHTDDDEHRPPEDVFIRSPF